MTNTLAYYGTGLITAVKSFMVQAMDKLQPAGQKLGRVFNSRNFFGMLCAHAAIKQNGLT